MSSDFAQQTYIVFVQYAQEAMSKTYCHFQLNYRRMRKDFVQKAA